MSATLKSRSFLLAIILFILIGWNLYLFSTPNHNTTWNYLFNLGYALLYLVGSLFTFLESRKFGIASTVGRALLFFSLGLLSYSLGQFSWGYYNIFLKVEVPLPSIADLFFISFYPLIILGLWFLLSLWRSFLTKIILINNIVILTATIIAVLFFTNSLPQSENISSIAQIFNVLYPLADAVLFTASIIVFRISGGKVQHWLIVIAFGLLITFAADLVFAYRVAHDHYWNGDSADSLYALAGFLLSLGMIKTAQNLNLKETTDANQQ